MTRTGQQIEDDVYELIKDSSLPSFINGGVYKFGMRPKNSTREDAVVKFITGLDGQIQTGVVLVNIYVPNIDPYRNGSFVRDIIRCAKIESLANEWVKTLTADKSSYLFQTMHTIYTEDASEINQNFITVRLKFKLSTI